jgi:hypothetical protein
MNWMLRPSVQSVLGHAAYATRCMDLFLRSVAPKNPLKCGGQYPCGGEIQYLHRSSPSRRGRRKRNQCL